MTKNQRYWTYFKNKQTGFVQVLEATWEGSWTDFRREDEGRIFKSKEEADKASKS